MIVVTGGTGQVGRRVAAGLAERGLEHRTIARRGGDVAVPGGYGDRAGMAAAFAGADVAFLIPAAEAPDRVAQHRTASTRPPTPVSAISST